MFYSFVSFTENLSRLNTTIVTHSSTFSENGAFKAKDGIRDSNALNCATTDINQSKAWLQVDLGSRYRINYINIYFRRQGKINYRLLYWLKVMSVYPITCFWRRSVRLSSFHKRHFDRWVSSACKHRQRAFGLTS